MKTFLILATLVFPAAADEVKSSVRFSNGDRISGSVESLGTDSLVWKSPILEKPVPFFLKNVMDLTLVPEQPDVTARHEASVTLTNGDLIRGQLVSVTDEAVELDTWFAGRIKFNRLMIADIRIAERPDFIYRGPSGLDGWKLSGDKPAWTYQNGGFRSVATGSIAREVALPDECAIAFDAAWRGSLGLKLVFFSDDLARENPATGYEIIFQQRSVQLRSCKTKRYLGHSPNAVALQQNEKAHIEIRASLKSGKICLYIDGQIIDVWTDPEVARTEIGRGIHFVSVGTAPVQVSRIEVRAWDGEVEQVPDPQAAAGIPDAMDSDEDLAPAAKTALESGRMELRNGDNIAGEVVSIVDGMITVKTPFREVKLPVETLRGVALKPVELERCKRQNGDVRAWLPDGSSIVFRLDATAEGALTGFSQNFGTATFKTAAFNRIEFNIYDPDLEDIRLTNGW